MEKNEAELTKEQALAVIQAINDAIRSKYGTGFVVVEVRARRMRRIYSAESRPVPPGSCEDDSDNDSGC